MRPRLFAHAQSTSKTTSFRPTLECFENRITPAGILPSANFVTTAKVGTTLMITANTSGGVNNPNNDNQVSLTGGKLAGKDTITVNSEFPIKGLKFFTGITNVNVVLKDGNDDFSVYDVVLTGYLTVNGGTGNNDIELESGGEGQGEGAATKIVGSTNIITLDGDDYLNISDAILGPVTVSLGGGNDVVAISSTSFAGPVFIDTGAGNDCVHLDTFSCGSSFNYPGINVMIPTLVVTLGDGDDYITMGPTGGQFFAGLSFISGGAGHNYEDHCSDYSDLSNVIFSNFSGGKS